jgi:DNA-directed RNA polymerase subunit RPC12/RpoP
VEIMGDVVVIWRPSEWESLCPYCGALNLSKTPAFRNICSACSKEYMAKIAQEHTEE